MDEIEDQDQQINDSSAELQQALAQAKENLDGWKRAQADLDNYRRRKEAESAEMINLGKAAAFSRLLPVLDSLQQAMLHAPEVADDKYNNWKNGLGGIAKQIEAALTEMGIKRIEALGKQFDPHLHEAIKEVPGEQDGLVAEEYQAGYTINDKLLRPAQVAITKRI